MSVVNCVTFKRRCGKSLSTVKCDAERGSPGPEGGSIFRIAVLSFSAQTKGTVRLLNAFYVTYGIQTIDFAIFVSMNPPTISHREDSARRTHAADVL